MYTHCVWLRCHTTCVQRFTQLRKNWKQWTKHFFDNVCHKWVHTQWTVEMCIHFVECKLVDWLFLSFWEGMAIPVYAIPKELCMLCCEPLPVHRLHTHTHTAWWAHENGRYETLLGVCVWVISTDAEFGMHHVCTCVLAHAIIGMVMMIRREKPWEGQPNTFHHLHGSMHTLLYLATVLL